MEGDQEREQSEFRRGKGGVQERERREFRRGKSESTKEGRDGV